MPVVSVGQAKTHLSRLLEMVKAGEEVVIARRGDPIARLVPFTPRGQRWFGAMAGTLVVDDGILEPLPEDELTLWEGGRSGGSA